MHHSSHLKLLRKPEVLVKCGISRSTLYTRIQDGLFTPPVKLGGRAVAWPESEVDLIISGIISGMPNGDLKKLISTLIIDRLSY